MVVPNLLNMWLGFVTNRRDNKLSQRVIKLIRFAVSFAYNVSMCEYCFYIHMIYILHTYLLHNTYLNKVIVFTLRSCTMVKKKLMTVSFVEFVTFCTMYFIYGTHCL